MSVPLLYRDEFLVVCEKPVGVSSETPGLPELVSGQIGRKVFPVHRLDKGTGGALILSLSPAACAGMQRLFLRDGIAKEYLAVISGRPQQDSGHYTDLLFHDRRTNRTFVVDRPRKGVREASCDWSVVCSVPFEDETLSLVRVSLHTGRTHQIRVQFASRGFPLAGDRRYGGKVKADAPALWACRVSFPHPCMDGVAVSAVSDPPDLFPWNLFAPGQA